MINKGRERTTKRDRKKDCAKSVNGEERVKIDQRNKSHKREKSGGRLEDSQRKRK